MDNIMLGLRKTGWSMDRIDLSQSRGQWKVLGESGNEPSGSTKCLEVLECLHNWCPLE
jgi:hypothetical protein